MLNTPTKSQLLSSVPSSIQKDNELHNRRNSLMNMTHLPQEDQPKLLSSQPNSIRKLSTIVGRASRYDEQLKLKEKEVQLIKRVDEAIRKMNILIFRNNLAVSGKTTEIGRKIQSLMVMRQPTLKKRLSVAEKQDGESVRY